MVLLALQFLARSIQALLGLPLEDHRIKAAPVEYRWAPSPRTMFAILFSALWPGASGSG